jgi:hypothetical protein
MKKNVLFLLIVFSSYFAYSGCGEPISFWGYNPLTLSYEQVGTGGVSTGGVVSGGDSSLSSGHCYFTLCPKYNHLRINFTSLATLPDGSTGYFAIVNPGDSLNVTIDVCGWGQNPSFTFHVSESTLQLTVPQTLTLPACSNGYTINGISASGGSGQYNYSSWFINGNGTIEQWGSSQPIISNVYNISSLLVQANDNTCSVSDTINIIPGITDSMYADICMLTIDSSNSHNLVTWEKNPNMGIVKYKIHKQSTLTSLYEMIHEQSFSSLSEFIDTSSNPNQEIARYKILAVDSCGYESIISANHTTVLLSSNLGANSVNLSWNPYEGFSYSNFEIWRSINGGISYNLLATVANNTYAYIDNNAPQQAYYQVRISNGSGCTTSKSSYNQVKSNIVDQAGNSVGFSEIAKNNIFSLFPNPTNDFFYIKSNQNQVGNTFEIVDNFGRIVLQGKITSDNMLYDANKLSSGIYNIKVQGEKTTTVKLVKN